MSVSKDGRTWMVQVRYKDWRGDSHHHKKRGFQTRREAQEYERAFIAKSSKDVGMGFADFVENYLADMKPQIKYNTYLSKVNIIRTHITPYFKNFSLSEIESSDILQWQNELLCKRDRNNKAYSQTYLRTIQNQLSAIFHHAERYYDLQNNPCMKVKKLGRAKADEMLFWTMEEYEKFIEVMKEKPLSYYAFEILYWTGVREGELLALLRKDISLERKTLTVNKSLQRLKGEIHVTSPKTEKSNRVIDLPDFLCRELEDYFAMLYKCGDDTRLFEFSKSYLHHEMDRGAKVAGVKRIRIHDLRHSHVAYLLELGYSAVEIAERLGHESANITYTYAHLYPSKLKDMAADIDRSRSRYRKALIEGRESDGENISQEESDRTDKTEKEKG